MHIGTTETETETETGTEMPAGKACQPLGAAQAIGDEVEPGLRRWRSSSPEAVSQEEAEVARVWVKRTLAKVSGWANDPTPTDEARVCEEA